MSSIQKIYSEISEKDKLDFVSSCFAKRNNLFGCPRLVIQNDLKKESINEIFTNQEKFIKIDEKYFPLIKDIDYSFLDTLDFKILFDTCQITFDKKDILSEYLDEDIKKYFNLNIRLIEQEKFIKTNNKHYLNKKTICEKLIYEKLNNIWKNRWSDPNSYLNNLNRFNLMI